MQTNISKTNYLFDSIFEPTRNSTSTFLINDNKEISYMYFHIMINQLANVLIKKGPYGIYLQLGEEKKPKRKRKVLKRLSLNLQFEFVR